MKNVFRSFFTCALILLLICCKSDDGSNTVVNSPPSQATNISASSITNTARILITWNAAVDENGDDVRYDVIINKELVKTNLSATSTEVDVSQFLSVSGKELALIGKGVEVTLEIEIKAYDPSNSFSNASITETLLINRAPTDFAFENIVFNMDSYDQLSIIWIPATDADDDVLTYAAYLNDIPLVEEYQIPLGTQYGTVIYTENFYSLSSSEMIIRVVVSDSAGETNEISQSFDFKQTDVALGALEAPYTEEVQFNVLESEPDNRVGYVFTVTEQTNYAISNSANATMQIKDATNTTISSNTTLEGVLEPGDYSLIVFGNGSADSSGAITFNLTSSSSTDVDLGVVVIPSENSYDLSWEGEQDNTINYYFEITNYTGYGVVTGYSILSVNLYNENGELVQSNSNGMQYEEIVYLAELPIGKYKLELIGGGLQQLNLVFSSANYSDQELGVLEVNTNIDITYTSEMTEFDSEVVYSFETAEITSFSMPSAKFEPVYTFVLVGNDGISYGDYVSYGRLVADNLPAGNYELKLKYNPFRYPEFAFDGGFSLQD